jgi:hydroxymethylbilane synthase
MTPSPSPRYRLGTRGSPLALAQAHMVAGLLAEQLAVPVNAIAITVLKTSGDRIQDRPLAEVGGKGLFTKELEDALLDGRIDLAVHSMKDVATVLPDGLAIVAVTARENPHDRLIGAAQSLKALPAGARLGTSSLRRAAQALAVRPDLQIVPFRGNVETRLAKLAQGQAEATLLAAAGLNRLGRGDIGATIGIDEMLPAVAQGIVGIQCRAKDEALCAVLQAFNHPSSWRALEAERAFLAVLDGSCRTPIAGFATLDGTALILTGEVLTPDGCQRVRQSLAGSVVDAQRIGAELGKSVRAEALWLA